MDLTFVLGSVLAINLSELRLSLCVSGSDSVNGFCLWVCIWHWFWVSLCSGFASACLLGFRLRSVLRFRCGVRGSPFVPVDMSLFLSGVRFPSNFAGFWGSRPPCIVGCYFVLGFAFGREFAACIRPQCCLLLGISLLVSGLFLLPLSSQPSVRRFSYDF